MNNTSAALSTSSNYTSSDINKNAIPSSKLHAQPLSHSGSKNRVTRISHTRKGQEKKSKLNPCILMMGVIATIFLTFIKLTTSSLHRAILEENQAYQEHQKMYGLRQQMNKPLNDKNTKSHDELQIQQSSSKLFVTVVLPSVVNPKGRHKRLSSIAKTWGPDANAVYVIHDPSEYVITSSKSAEEESSSIFPQTLHVPESVATVEQGVPRLKYVMETIYQKYDPDYIFFVNDHTYVIPQHFCNFLNQYRNNNADASDKDVSDRNGHEHHYLYAGHALKPEGAKYAFNSGAAGYFLSRETMKELIDRQRVSDSSSDSDSNNSKNKPNSISNSDGSIEKECSATRKWLQGNPGLVTANCLKMTMNVDPIDTRDELGRHLFHAYGIIRTVKREFDSWYLKKHATLKEIWGEVSYRAQYLYIYVYVNIYIVLPMKCMCIDSQSHVMQQFCKLSHYIRIQNSTMS